MTLPAFRYHADPVASGSVISSEATCRCCDKSRGYVYAGPVYAEEDGLDDALCPWCIADGSAHQTFDAVFTDTDAFDDAGIPPEAQDEIAERTPGINAWQGARWPACCGDATSFIMPAGIKELRARDYTLEGPLMSHIVHEMGISGGSALRLMESLRKDAGPTVYLFRCEKCLMHHFHVDQV